MTSAVLRSGPVRSTLTVFGCISTLSARLFRLIHTHLDARTIGCFFTALNSPSITFSNASSG